MVCHAIKVLKLAASCRHHAHRASPDEFDRLARYGQGSVGLRPVAD